MPEPIDVVEALLFASDTPVEAERIQEVLDLESAAAAREIVEGLRVRLDAEGRALQVMEVGGGFRLVTRPEVAPWLVKLARSRTRSRLSRPALETLAIIGYRQRSEEHTSELQSRRDLVCRLLLEKKKKNQNIIIFQK